MSKEPERRRAGKIPFARRLLALGICAAAGVAGCANLAGIQTLDPAVDGQGGAFCGAAARPTAAGSLFLCDDFDDGSLPAPWSSEYQTAGTLTVDGAIAASPPGSLDLVVNPLVASESLNVSLRTLLVVPPFPATIAFEFNLDPVKIDPAAGAAIVICALDFLDPNQNRYTVQLAFDVQNGEASTVLDELYSDGSPYIPHPITPPLPVGSFTNVTLAIDWTGAETANAQVLFGSASVLSVPLAMNVAAATLQISIGTTYATEPSPGWEVRYDNVLFRATP
jgi:hypothetical protein